MTTSAQRFDKGPGRAPRIAAGRVGLLGLLSLGCLAGTASAQATFRILGPDQPRA